MLRKNSARAYLRASTALLFIASLAGPSVAQEASQDIEGDYLGLLILGESKRDVATDTSLPVTVIDQVEIQDRQAGTIAELIDTVPGVNLVNGATTAGSGINIRGFGANPTYGTDQKVIIQIDGVTKGSEELYRIGSQLFTDPFLFKEVEVLRGTAGSFEYGSGVVGGVVRLETIDAKDLTGGDPGFKLRQTLQFDSNGDGIASSTTTAWQPTENLEFLANYSYRSLSIQTDGNGNEINPDGGDIGDPSWLLKGKLTFGDAADQSITLSLSETQQDSRDVPYDSFGTANFGNVDRFTQNKVASMRYNWNPADRSWLNLSAEISYSDEVINNQAIDRTASAFTLALLDADHQYETTSLRIKNEALLTTGAVDHTLRTGVEFTRRTRLNAFAAPGGDKDVVALYAIDEMEFGGWTVTPAVRYETQTIKPDEDAGAAENEYSFNALMGGVSARYEFGSGFAVFGSASYTENLPILDDLTNATFIEQSEKATTYEVGVSYFGESALREGDRFAVKLNYYDIDLRDVTSYSGVSRVERSGFELEASYALKSGVYADLNAHISEGSEFDSAGVESDWDDNPTDSLRLTLGRKFENEVDVSWEMAAAKGYADESAGYGVHSLRATYLPQRGLLAGTEIRVGIENIFDSYYQPHLSTRPAAGRNVKLTLSRVF